MRERGCPREDIIRHAGRVAHFAVVAGKAALFDREMISRVLGIPSVLQDASAAFQFSTPGAPPTCPSTVT